MKASAFQSIGEIKKTVNKWLLLDDQVVVEVIAAALLANLLEGDPLWIFINGPPSSAKTELLRALAGHDKVYLLSSLTPSTLISGQKPKRGKDPSLLLELNDKVLVLKDFTTILTMRHETRQEILSQLREIYDGKYTKAFGTGKTIDWEGKVGFISGVTPYIDKCHGVNQMLGERFLMYRVDEDLDPTMVALAAAQKAGQEKQMREELRDAFGSYLKQFDETWQPRFKADNDLEHKIACLATFCARARTAVSRDRWTREVDILPKAEGPARLVKQLTMLSYGMRMLNGPDHINDDLENVYGILRRIGASTLPSIRAKILRAMYEQGVVEGNTSYDSPWEKTKVISEETDLPTVTVRLLLEDLTAIRMVNRRLDTDSKDNVTSTTPHVWQLSRLAAQLIKESQVFEP